jgi:hypothetical protein
MLLLKSIFSGENNVKRPSLRSVGSEFMLIEKVFEVSPGPHTKLPNVLNCKLANVIESPLTPGNTDPATVVLGNKSESSKKT